MNLFQLPSLCGAPAWARHLSKKLNDMHAYQLETRRMIMQEVDNLNAAIARMGNEIPEAIAKIKAIIEARTDANDAETAELKTTAADAAAAINKRMDELKEALPTFSPSGN